MSFWAGGTDNFRSTAQRAVIAPDPLALFSHLLQRSRLSRPGLQHPLFFGALPAPFQKIDLHGLLTNLAFHLRHSAFIPSPLAGTRKSIA